MIKTIKYWTKRVDVMEINHILLNCFQCYRAHIEGNMLVNNPN